MLSITLFGATAVTTDSGETITNLGGIKPRQILELLSISPGTPVPKDRLAELLWSGEPPKSYVGTLESYVCVLRGAIGAGRGRNSVVATTSCGYVLDARQVRVDLTEARTLIRAANASDPRAATEMAGQAVELAREELLATDAYASWAVHERNLFRREMGEACNRASVLAFSLSDYESAIRFARQAVSADQYAEHAWQNLMRALWASGRRCEALRAFMEMRSLLVEGLGMDPGPVSHALYMEILCDEGSSATAVTNGHHVEVTTLVGLLRQAIEAMSGADPASARNASGGSLPDAVLRLLTTAA